ncbi:acetolactate synthase small subunit [Nocardioides daeguensis]|uniref:Acetolactate synthase small subunit n=1 Tax=Nocardioides daeguensis TaxID=908359 RepID=A0ABP6VHX5_9ACTN|nr:acetolactate synthase small subunit [Nocardioides daeguensis]MBV6729023.1 acetolactate synthase small subunit [Nocardioides daeguensis]MCR1773544.1 acetolactate synthase small subunit [Nocardioides daeguensis]
MLTGRYVLHLASTDAVRSVVQLLAARQVEVVTLSVAADADGTATLHLTATLPDLASGELLVKRLNRLIDVVKTVEVSAARFHEREAVLVRVEAEATTRRLVLDVADAFGADVVEVKRHSLTLGLFAEPRRVRDFLTVLADHPISELVGSGVLPVRRGGASLRRRPAASVDASREPA